MKAKYSNYQEVLASLTEKAGDEAAVLSLLFSIGLGFAVIGLVVTYRLYRHYTLETNVSRQFYRWRTRVDSILRNFNIVQQLACDYVNSLGHAGAQKILEGRNAAEQLACHLHQIESLIASQDSDALVIAQNMLAPSPKQTRPHGASMEQLNGIIQHLSTDLERAAQSSLRAGARLHTGKATLNALRRLNVSVSGPFHARA